ncbi:MAG: SusD/RagB family nutrient-binding outer membrane lipoprotein [Rikenellaceae bacterium]
MNIYRKILMTVGVAATTLISSCDKKFDEINTNPNDPTEVSTDGLMTQTQRNIAYTFGNGWYGLRLKGIMCQHWAQPIYSDEDNYNFSSRASTIYVYFNYAYLYSQQLQEIIDLCEANPLSMSVYGDADAQIASAKILQCMMMLQVVETFGDVPYSQANNILEYPTPAYDDQESIYKDIIEKLKTYAADLEGCGDAWVAGDILLDGDSEKWMRFANSLRLRTAMRLSNFDPTYSATEAAAAIASGVMESNDDNAVFEFIGVGSPGQHPTYSGQQTRIDYIMSAQFVDLLKGYDNDLIGFKNPFSGIVDPRLSIFALSPNQIAAGVDPMSVLGMPYGVDAGNANTVWVDVKSNTDNVIIYNFKTGSLTENDIPRPMQADFITTYFDYANVAFLDSELSGYDAAKFEAGMTASMEMWEVDADSAAEYIAKVMALFNAADTEMKKEILFTQKYIHNYGHCEYEAYQEVVRSGYPKSILVGGDAAAVADGETYYFEPYQGEKVFIQRFPYALTEYNYNGASVADAVANMGGSDRYDVPLIYSILYKK